MTMQEVRKLTKNNKITLWIEAGMNILELNEKLKMQPNPATRFKMLEKLGNTLYIFDNEKDTNKYTLEFCRFGRIIFSNGQNIWYVIDNEPKK